MVTAKFMLGFILASLGLLGIGLVYLLFIDASDIGRLRDRLAAVSPGDSAAKVVRVAGEPDERCSGSSEIVAPVEWRKRDRADEIRKKLEESTELRFIYRVRERKILGAPECAPLYDDAVLGFSSEGVLLWLVRSAGESPVEYAEELLMSAG